MPPTRVKAIILKRINFRETSVIVHLLSDTNGKIAGIMKGVRVSQKKIPPLVYQQGSCIEAFVYFRSKPGLELVTQPSLLNSFNFSGENLVLWKKILSEIDRFVPIARFNSKGIYDILSETGILIPYIKNQRAIEVIVTEKILFELGFGPFLEKCLICGSKNNLNFFSGKLGGIICSHCYAKEPTSFKLPEKHVQVLKFFHRVPVNQVSMVKYIPETLFKNLMKCLNEIVLYHISE